MLAPALLSYQLSSAKVVQPMLTEDDTDFGRLFAAIVATVENQHEQRARFDELTPEEISERDVVSELPRSRSGPPCTSLAGWVSGRNQTRRR